MMPLRNLARAAPRAAPRLSVNSSSSRRWPSVQASSVLRAAGAQTQKQVAGFSSSALRREPAGETNRELSTKLASEISFENTIKDESPEPASVTDFLENGPFKLEDIPGSEEVKLTREFGNEHITITFSISDLNAIDPTDYENDPVLGDDAPMLDQYGQQDQAAEASEENMEEDGEPASTPAAKLNIVVEKKNHAGALNIEATAQDGHVSVDSLFYYGEPAMAHSSSAEVDHKARDIFPGPSFETLDEDLQLLMDRYLEERGISQALAVFVTDYMDIKEQREYMSWLGKVKGFIDA